MSSTDLTISALDGTALPATLFEPSGAVRAAAVVSSATAVPRGHYRAFAEYLTGLGVAVVTYDYRGQGGEIAALRASNARMRDWGELDFPGVVEFMAGRYPGVPLHAVGHSIGGHVLLMAPNGARIARAVTVASQIAYWRYYAPVERYRAYFFVKVMMPITTALAGFFPGRALRFGENLARGVLYEWSRWCTSPAYFYSDPTMARTLEAGDRFGAPTTIIGLTDDLWATPIAVDAFAQRFVNAPVDRRSIDPREVGLQQIGHMGFFKPRNGAVLWPIVAEYLGFIDQTTRSEQLV